MRGAIEDERRRLARAEALLGCLRVVLTSEERPRAGVVDLEPVAELAEQLVHEAIERLDALYLEPMIGAVGKSVSEDDPARPRRR